MAALTDHGHSWLHIPVQARGSEQGSRRVEPAERCSSLAAAFEPLSEQRLSVLLSMKGEVERETGLEPATFSLEGLSVYALWHPSW